MTAVLVLCLLHPSRIILVFFLPLPIWVFVGFQVLRDAYTFLSREPTTTAVSVHLAGALFGFCYFRFRWRLMDFWPNWKNWQKRQRRPRLKVYHEEPARVAPSGQARESDEMLEAKLDAVLQKVAEKGQDSLTESERNLLLKASEIYKRRRT